MARLARALKAMGYRPKVPVSLEAFLDKRRQVTKYAKQISLPLVGIVDLIKMKLRAGRDRDLSDVESLEKVKTLQGET